MHLLTMNNTKILKGEARGYQTFILHLSPYNLSGHQVCPMASKGCAAACLNTAGMGRFPNVQEARIRKTKLFFEQRDLFLEMLKADISNAKIIARKNGLIPCVRLNGTSDLRWENYGIPQAFPEVTFYDYTAISNRKDLPSNYHLTFSRKETTSNETIVNVMQSMNVAVVFREVPTTYLGFPVMSGDEDDLRFLDPKGHIIGLSAKGKARKDTTSGFVVDTSKEDKNNG